MFTRRRQGEIETTPSRNIGEQEWIPGLGIELGARRPLRDSLLKRCIPVLCFFTTHSRVTAVQLITTNLSLNGQHDSLSVIFTQCSTQTKNWNYEFVIFYFFSPRQKRFNINKCHFFDFHTDRFLPWRHQNVLCVNLVGFIIPKALRNTFTLTPMISMRRSWNQVIDALTNCEHSSCIFYKIRWRIISRRDLGPDSPRNTLSSRCGIFLSYRDRHHHLDFKGSNSRTLFWRR